MNQREPYPAPAPPLPVLPPRLEAALNHYCAQRGAERAVVIADAVTAFISSDPFGNVPPRSGRIAKIQIAVAAAYGVTRTDLISSRRTHNVVRPRQVAMFLAKTITLMSLPQIGRQFGNRDHTTVLRGARKIVALRQTDPDLRRRVDSLLDQLKPLNEVQEVI